MTIDLSLFCIVTIVLVVALVVMTIIACIEHHKRKKYENLYNNEIRQQTLYNDID